MVLLVYKNYQFHAYIVLGLTPVIVVFVSNVVIKLTRLNADNVMGLYIGFFGPIIIHFCMYSFFGFCFYLVLWFFCLFLFGFNGFYFHFLFFVIMYLFSVKFFRLAGIFNALYCCREGMIFLKKEQSYHQFLKQILPSILDARPRYARMLMYVYYLPIYLVTLCVAFYLMQPDSLHDWIIIMSHILFHAGVISYRFGLDSRVSFHYVYGEPINFRGFNANR